MDAVRLMGETVKKTAEATRERDSIGCAKLVVLCNAPDDNPFMAGAFHGVTEGDAVINVGVSGPGVVNYVLRNTCRGESFEVLCETIKRTAFKDTSGICRIDAVKIQPLDLRTIDLFTVGADALGLLDGHVQGIAAGLFPLGAVNRLQKAYPIALVCAGPPFWTSQTSQPWL